MIQLASACFVFFLFVRKKYMKLKPSKLHVPSFSNNNNTNKLIGQTLLRALLGLDVHGLYFLSDNVASTECIFQF